MLSRKVAGAELLGAAAAVDRGRVGERLQAALAGLLELQVLREKQRDRVRWALRMDREKPVSSSGNNRDSDTSTEERRLEQTLSALKQQLTRLRRQDVGLKTHLQQLDQQISELKLDVCKASAEHLESDSRPSSGFYELSDGGLGSLSNSCTSVYSECLSSSSQASLLPTSSGRSALHSHSTLGQGDVARRRSADESTAQSDGPRGLGVRLGIRTTSVSSERARQRPVSTGDLDRVIGPGFGYCKPVDVKTSNLCSNLCNPPVDTKYQSNLVCRNGMEVYRYPSPLHAVALQSPLFTLGGDQGELAAFESQENETKVMLAEDTRPKQELTDPRPVGYIAKLVQRSSSRTNLQNETGTGKVHVSCSDTEGHGLIGPRSKELKIGRVGVAEVRQKTVLLENSLRAGISLPPRNIGQEQVNLINGRLEEPNQMRQVQYPTITMDHKAPPQMGPMSKVKEKCDEKKQNSDRNKDDFLMVSKPPERIALISSSEENRSSDGGHTRPSQSEFVHAQFVPAGSQRVKVHQADKKSKAVKLRKRSNEKPSGKKNQQKHSFQEQEKDRGCAVKARGDRDLRQTNEERERIDGRLRDARIRSCSESSLLGPGKHASASQSQTQQKSSKPWKAQFLEPGNPLLCQPRKKQSSRKWPSASEIQLPPGASTHYQSSKALPTHRLPQKHGIARSLSMRPRSGHWGGVPHPVQPTLSSSSYLSSMNFRYPPAPSCTRYPPRCESEFSEYSAECASLFHSTIAESSEGELSDYTTNRFGDSESSQESRTASDSDSSLSLDEDDALEEEDEDGDLVWAEEAVGPTTAGLSLQQHPRPEPVACRIKASRALKKKIRRFQPASLKVMTLV